MTKCSSDRASRPFAEHMQHWWWLDLSLIRLHCNASTTLLIHLCAGSHSFEGLIMREPRSEADFILPRTDQLLGWNSLWFESNRRDCWNRWRRFDRNESWKEFGIRWLCSTASARLWIWDSDRISCLTVHRLDHACPTSVGVLWKDKLACSRIY